MAGVVGGIIFFVGAIFLSHVVPNVEDDRVIFGLASLVFVLLGVAEAIARAFRK